MHGMPLDVSQGAATTSVAKTAGGSKLKAKVAKTSVAKRRPQIAPVTVAKAP
jgi:hypothetical protein